MEGNPYYDPEKWGLTLVGEVEWSDGCYQFNKSVVWKDANGQLYYAQDSGCSCPSPFEGLADISDLEPVTALEAIERLSQYASNDTEYISSTAHLDLVGRLRQVA